MLNRVELRDLIQIGADGSKIPVTTHNHFVASMMGTVPSHILEGLFLEDSLWHLVKWAFKEKEEEEKYPHLINIGKEIVKKCRGIPFSVRTLLFSKFEANEWEYVRNNEVWNFPPEKMTFYQHFKLQSLAYLM